MENIKSQPDLSSIDQLSLRCPIHQQYIIGYYPKQTSNRYLKCAVCIQEQKLSFDILITLPNFQLEVSKLQGALSGVSKLKVDAKLREIDYSDNLNQLQSKVNEEKETLRKNFDELIEQFTKQCNQKYENTCILLDTELKQLRNNIKSYNNFIKDCSQSANSPFQEFLAKLVAIKDVDSYENLISQFISYQEFSDLIQIDFNQGSDIISDALKQFQELINSQLTLISQESNVSTQSKNKIQELKKQVGQHFEQFGQFKEEIIPLLISDCLSSFDKSAILSQKDSKVLTTLARGQFKKKFKAKLVYQGTIHGFTASNFHSNCDPYAHTITVIESKDGEKLGGYSDNSWNQNVGTWVRSKNTWLFSIDKNKVYPIENQEQYAIWAGSTLLPTFGYLKQNDLRIEDSCNIVNCSSALGNSYASKGDKYLTSQQYFQVKEIEVYEISFQAISKLRKK